MKSTDHPNLYTRQKVLLALLQKFSNQLSSVNLQKYLFLFTQVCQEKKSYEFIPYRYGCFSFQSYADCRKLVEFGILKNNNGWWSLNTTDVDYTRQLNLSTQKKLDLFHNRYKSLKDNDLIKKIYREYPYFAINSEIATDLMSDKELAAIEEQRPSNETTAFFTIGYESQSFENYLNRLLRNNVHVLCDVRKNPLSRKYGFSKKTLSETLGKLGIDYVHMPELGITSDKRQHLKSQSDYDRLFDEYERTTLKENKQAIDDLMKIVRTMKRIAITCFEAKHCMCHRGRVAYAINQHPEYDFPITHI